MSKTSPTQGVAPHEKTSRAGRNLPAAIASGVVLVSTIVCTLLWWNWGFVLLAALSLGAATVELHRGLAKKGIHTPLLPVLIGTVATILTAYGVTHPVCTTVRANLLPANTVILALLALTILVSLTVRLGKGTAGYVRDASATVLVIGYCAVLGSTLILMLSDPHGTARVTTFILVTAASDTGGYIAGVLFGKHPMAPAVSPKKSWEGFAGSVILATAAAIGLTFIALQCPWWVGLILGPVLAAVGTAGDLIESSIKRDLGIKDMSNFIPGHGGVMDRLDSLLANAPVAWFLLYLLVP